MQPKRIFTLFSHGASAIRFLIEHDKTNYNKRYTIVGSLTDNKDASGISLMEENGIPCAIEDLRMFADYFGYTGKLKNIPDELREKYFEHIKPIISIKQPDLIILSGLLRKIPPSFIGKIPMINVHPADLSIMNPLGGSRKYIGLGNKVVAQAIEDGQPCLRSTVHVVTSEIDGGEIISLSNPMVIDRIKMSAHDHQELMKTKCDGPAVKEALYKICTGLFKFERQLVSS